MKLFNNTPNSSFCSMELGPEGLAVAYSSNPKTREFSLCEFYPREKSAGNDLEQFKNLLLNVVSRYHLKQTKCNWVLHPDCYKIAMLKTPNVARTEYRKAVRWQVKDIIDYPLEDVAVDIFYPHALEQIPKKIFVVAAQQRWLKEVATIIRECALKLVAIDIRQFALRNLIVTNPAEKNANQNVGILELIDNNCVTTLLHGRDIHLVRKFPINMEKLRQGNHGELCEELQRSFDYCVTELEGPIPQKLWFLPHEAFTQEIIDKIGGHLNQSAALINLNNLVKFTPPPSSDHGDHYHAVLGGALRTLGTEE